MPEGVNKLLEPCILRFALLTVSLISPFSLAVIVCGNQGMTPVPCSAYSPNNNESSDLSRSGMSEYISKLIASLEHVGKVDENQIVKDFVMSKDSELKISVIEEASKNPDLKFIPLLIGLLRDDNQKISGSASAALFGLTNLSYDYGENTPVIIIPWDEPILKDTKIREWENWYDINRNIIPSKRNISEITEEELKVATEKLINRSRPEFEEKCAKKIAQDQSLPLQVRAEQIISLRKNGKREGFNSILPELLQVTKANSHQEEKKIVEGLIQKSDPATIKEQFLYIIASDKEQRYIRISAINLASQIPNYFNSDEIKQLISRERDSGIMAALIRFFGYVGKLSDVPYFLKLAESGNEEVQTEIINTLSFLAAQQKWLNAPSTKIGLKDDSQLKAIVLRKWAEWWNQINMRKK